MRAKSLVLIALLLFGAAPALADHHETGVEPEAPGTLSGSGSDGTRPLQATFEAPPEPGMYTTRYYFAMTRGLSNSTLRPAFQLPLFLVTVPLDIVLLPMAALVGFF
jgi:hypothetical protein